MRKRFCEQEEFEREAKRLREEEVNVCYINSCSIASKIVMVKVVKKEIKLN